VDIDLTYLQRDARNEALASIGAALERIAARVEATMPGSCARHWIASIPVTCSM
jgi:hypothetical protein